MNRTFNNGIGMVVVVDPSVAPAAAAMLRAAGESVHVIGAIAAARCRAGRRDRLKTRA